MRPHIQGGFPFFVACQEGYREVVSLLLADLRIDPNKPRTDQSSPLWVASFEGYLSAVQRLLTSGWDMNTKMKCVDTNTAAAEQGRLMPSIPKSASETEEEYQLTVTDGPLCGDLIDDYDRDPVAARYRLRRQPGLREYFAGHLFALVVFYSDNFVAINERMAHSDTERFFTITSQLPLDLQMVLCNRIFVSPKDIILSRDSEPGFRLLARTTTWQQ